MRVQHETYSTICGTPVQAILDQNFLTGLAGWVWGGQGRSKYGQEGASRYKHDAKLLFSDPSRGPKWVKDPGKSYPYILMTYSKHLDVWNVNTNVYQMNLFMRSRHENGHMSSNRKSFWLLNSMLNIEFHVLPNHFMSRRLGVSRHKSTKDKSSTCASKW